MNPHLLAASLGMPLMKPKAAPSSTSQPGAPKGASMQKGGVAGHLKAIKKHHAAGNHKQAKVSALNLAKLLGGMQSGAGAPPDPTAAPAAVPPAAA